MAVCRRYKVNIWGLACTTDSVITAGVWLPYGQYSSKLSWYDIPFFFFFWGVGGVKTLIGGILPKGPYLPCVSMAGRALLAGYPRYELLNIRALKFKDLNKIHIFPCMGKIFCVEFQREHLKFHTKYLAHTLKDIIFIQSWNFKGSLI